MEEKQQELRRIEGLNNEHNAQVDQMKEKMRAIEVGIKGETKMMGNLSQGKI